ARAAGLAAAEGARRREARLVRYEDNLVEVEVRTNTGGFLLINDRYEAPWRAYVDGNPAAVFRANLIMRGVWVPAGASRVVLRFEPSAWAGYVGLAALGVVIVVVVPWMVLRS
ncbi:MAG: YfhO family protein, partial [Verrucomicrobiae bacterium]|nr:YfhO family protein [Verrucomicrobiae bacterium]